MYMYVCMYACMHACMYNSIYIYMYMYVDIRLVQLFPTGSYPNKSHGLLYQ